MAVEVERVFIGAGCNRIVHDVSWGACDLLAFGVQNAVAIFCPKSVDFDYTSGAQSVSKNLEMHYMLSGDADGEILPWEFSLADRKCLKNRPRRTPRGAPRRVAGELGTEAHASYEPPRACASEDRFTPRGWRNVVQIPEKHKKGVTCITTIVMSQTSATFASSSPDGVLVIMKALPDRSLIVVACFVSVIQSRPLFLRCTVLDQVCLSLTNEKVALVLSADMVNHGCK
ncbi:hypothetical protein OROGR_020748 [Orobanche gracilis]